jgi:gliding motility-associated-like protein
MSGSYTLTVTDGNKCTGTASTSVTVNANPIATASNNGPLCVGSQLELTGGPNGVTYSWGGPNTYSSTTKSPVVSSNATTGMSGAYILTVTDGNKCTGTASTSVTVNANPVATASNNGPLCVGSQLELIGGPNGVTYSWDGPNAYSSTTKSPVVSSNATTGMSGAYTLTVTDGNKCTGTASTSVTVNANPIATASNNGSLCAGSQLELTGGPNGVTYSWDGPNAYSSTTKSPVVSSNATTGMSGTYTLMVDDGKCRDTTITTVTVYANPVAIASNNGPLCEGSQLELSGGPIGMTYSWDGPNTYSSTAKSPVVSSNATTGMSGTYTLMVDDGKCRDTIITTVTVYVNPVATASNNGPLCEGAQFNLTGGPTGMTYSWVGPNAYSSTTKSPAVSSSATTGMSGIYSLIVGDGKCSDTASTLVTVNVNPIAIASNNGPLCVGDQLILNGGSNGLSYSWSGPSGYNSVSQSPVLGTVTTSMAGSYSLVVTDVNNCSSLLATNVTVNALPNVSAGADQVSCDGDSVVLLVSGATVYSWNNSVSLSSSSVTSPIASPADTTTYIVTGTDANNCINTDSVIVSVNALPNVSAGADQVICEGDSVILSGLGAMSYSWDNGVLNGVSFMPAAGVAPYALTGIDSNGCVGYSSVNVTVNVFDLPVISDTIYCYGSDKFIDLGQYKPQSVQWTPSNGVSVMPGNLFNISPVSTTTYSLLVADSNGCYDSGAFNISVVDSIDLQLSGDTAVCPNEDVNLYVNGAANPIWSNGELAPLINVTITKDTSFMVTDSNICGSVSKIVYVDMYGLPYIDAGNDQQINYGQNTQLNATSNNVSGYSWTPAYYLDNSSVKDPIAEPEETTTFVLSVVSSNGCESNDTMTVYVEEEKVVRIPTAFTPNNDGKNDRYFISGKGICDLNISIFNRWGELIFQGSGIDASWDGTYNDEKQPLETYAVLVDVEFCDQSQESYRNNITLIR